MSGNFGGEAKTDARDAVVIANTIRMRHHLLTIAPTTDCSPSSSCCWSTAPA
jgi:hypothetical protein